jgi:hypothetical protein
MKITNKYRKDLEANYPIGTVIDGSRTNGDKFKGKITKIGGYNDRGYVSIFVENKEGKTFIMDAETMKNRYKIVSKPKEKKEKPISKKIIKQLMPKVGEYVHTICEPRPHFYKVIDVSDSRMKIVSIADYPVSYDKGSGNQSGFCAPDIINDTPDDCNIWAQSDKWVDGNPAGAINGVITCNWKVKKDTLSINNGNAYLSMWKRDLFSLEKWDGKPVHWSTAD